LPRRRALRLRISLKSFPAAVRLNFVQRLAQFRDFLLGRALLTFGLVQDADDLVHFVQHAPQLAPDAFQMVFCVAEVSRRVPLFAPLFSALFAPFTFALGSWTLAAIASVTSFASVAPTAPSAAEPSAPGVTPAPVVFPRFRGFRLLLNWAFRFFDWFFRFHASFPPTSACPVRNAT
jgi:hypothetical protein